MKKILVVGGVAGGASAAARARRLDERSEIIVFERGPYPSFSNCCLPNFLSREIPDSSNLLIYAPEDFKKLFNIDVRVEQEVTKIFPEEKKVTVKDLKAGQEYQESYDELILSPGANAILPKSIEGIDKDHVFTVKNVPDVRKLDDYIRGNDIKDIVVVGGGFIGLEVMENLKMAGFEVTLVEGTDQIMAPLDYDMVQILNKEIYDHGVNLILEDSVKQITDDEVVLESGKKIKAGAVVMAVGVAPETTLAKDAGIEIGELGGIKVNQYYQTSKANIYAVGDVIETHNFITEKKTKLALAGPAQMQARACVDHIYGMPISNKGVVGSSVVKVFDFNAASTGLNEKDCKKLGIDYRFSMVIPFDKVSLMPEANPLFFKLIFAYPSGKILGAQAIGKGDSPKRIDVVAALIQKNGTVEDLKDIELCYAPDFSTAKDVVNMGGLAAHNLLHGRMKQVHMTELDRLVKENAVIIDVRGETAFNAGHVKGAKNIPLAQLRDRLDEIPRDVPVYLHCRSSQTSYFAYACLAGNGYTNMYNISGSFLGMSYYNYFNDVTTGREPLLTAYNFN